MYLCAHGLSFNIRPTGRFFGDIPKPDDIKTDIALIKESGFDAYELWVEKLTAYLRHGSAAELAALITAAGVKVPAFCTDKFTS